MAAAISEDQLLKAVLECAALLGWLCYHPRPARTEQGWRTPAEGNGAKGFPDLTLAHRAQGRILFAELKADKGTLSPDQEHWLETLAPATWPGHIDVHIWKPTDWLDGTIENALRAPKDAVRFAPSLPATKGTP